MHNFRQIFGFEFRRQIRRRAYLFTTFGIPIVALIILFGYQAFQEFKASRPAEEEPASSSETEFGPIGYVDRSGEFQNPGLYGMGMIRYDDEDAALEAMQTGEVKTVYVIEPDYMESGDVTRYVTSFGIESMAADGLFQSFLYNGLLRGADRQLILRLQSDLYIVEHQVAQSGEATVARGEDESFLLVYVFAVVLMVAIFFSSGYLMQSVVEEKETRMVEIMLSSVRPMHLLAGKLFSAGVLGLAQIVIWGATAIFIISRLGTVVPALIALSVPPGMLLWVLLYFAGAYLLFAGAYASVGAISQSMREGPQFAMIFTLPAVFPLYFVAFIAKTPNAPLPVFLSLFPVTSPLGMIMRLSVTEVPFIQIAVSLVLLFATAVGSIWFAARLFRVNILLAGQMPKWRDIIRLVREK